MIEFCVAAVLLAGIIWFMRGGPRPPRIGPLALVVMMSTTGCAALGSLLTSPVVAAGIGAADSIATAVAQQRGAALSQAERDELIARIAALESALAEQKSCSVSTTDAAVSALPSALEREVVARGAVAVAQAEVARYLAQLQTGEAK